MSSDLRRYATSRVGRGCGVASGLSNGSWVSGSWLGGLSWCLAGWRVRIGAMPTVPRALRHMQNVTDSKPAGCVLPIPAGSPRPASAGGLGTSARRPPSPPVRRNPANPARAGRQAPRTATRHHATTWEKRPRESSPSRQGANAQVKREVSDRPHLAPIVSSRAAQRHGRASAVITVRYRAYRPADQVHGARSAARGIRQVELDG